MSDEFQLEHMEMKKKMCQSCSVCAFIKMYINIKKMYEYFFSSFFIASLYASTVQMSLVLFG